MLIDADNIGSAAVGAILGRLADFGETRIVRAYTDWSLPTAASWRRTLRTYSIRPIQAMAYATDKTDCTDIVMVADAVELLHTTTVSAFAIVSSDSDFTALAIRLREAGRTVYGIGHRQTPRPLVHACHRFLYIEELTGAKTAHTRSNSATPAPHKPSSANAAGKPGPSPRDAETLRRMVCELADDNGWAALSQVCTQIRARHPQLDPTPTGHNSKLGKYLRTCGLFDVADLGGKQGHCLRNKHHPALPSATASQRDGAPDRRTEQRLREAISPVMDHEGWASLSAVCNQVHAQHPGFDPILNGQRLRLGRYLRECGFFEVLERSRTEGGPVYHLRDKQWQANTAPPAASALADGAVLETITSAQGNADAAAADDTPRRQAPLEAMSAAP